MRNKKKQTHFLSKKAIRSIALLLVALLTTCTVLILGGFEIEWQKAWQGLLDM